MNEAKWLISGRIGFAFVIAYNENGSSPVAALPASHPNVCYDGSSFPFVGGDFPVVD
jgi:hypothetical protein